MSTSANFSSIPISIYQNTQSSQPAKFEKIPNLSSKESNQEILAEKEPIYDVPQNNRLVEKLTLYEKVSRVFSNLYKRISNLLSRKPNQMEMLEGKVKQLFEESANLILFTAQLQQKNEKLCHYIYVNAACIHALKDMVYAKEAQIYSLEETISALEVDLYRPTQTSRSDSGFSEPPPIRKKTKGLFSKAKSYLEDKVG